MPWMIKNLQTCRQYLCWSNSQDVLKLWISANIPTEHPRSTCESFHKSHVCSGALRTDHTEGTLVACPASEIPAESQGQVIKRKQWILDSRYVCLLSSVNSVLRGRDAWVSVCSFRALWGLDSWSSGQCYSQPFDSMIRFLAASCC